MYRYTKIIVFFLSVFIATGATAQTLSTPLPNDVLKKALKQHIATQTRADILIDIVRNYIDYSIDKNRYDSANFYLNQARKYIAANNTFLSQRLKILDLATLCIKSATTDNAARFLPLINECSKNGDKVNEALAWSQYASNIDWKPENYVSITAAYQQAYSLSKATNELQFMLYQQAKLGNIYVAQHQYGLAEKELLAVINHPKANSWNLLFALEYITNLYFQQGITDKALYYALKNERLMESSGDSLLAVNYFGNLSNIYISLNKTEESIYWSKRALEHSIIIKDYGLVYKIMNSIVIDYLRLRKTEEALDYISQITKKYAPHNNDDKRILNMAYGNVYMDQKKYALAEKYFQEMYRFSQMESESDFPVDERATNNLKFGDLYVRMGKYKKAKAFLDIAMKDYVAEDRKDLLRMAHRLSFKADSALGLYLSAIKHLQITQQISDTILNLAKSKQVEEFQIAYQTEKKEKDIALLKGFERQQNIKLLHAENTRNLIIIGSCLLAIIIALLIWQNRTRQKNNQIITQKNEYLEQLISEKDWLLKEVHHRVKNNLHTVICLLESQANYLESDALKAIETSQHRIYAMSLIHQKLYQSDDIKTIDMQDYIGELVCYLKESFGPIENIDITFSVPSLKLGVTHAIPLGLIINESVTNAIQHAFPGNIKGNIHIQLNRYGDNITLLIEDNGIGIGYDVHETETESLGIELIKGLAMELKGHSSFEDDNGTKIIISFSLDPFEKMISQNEPEQALV